MPGRCPRFVLTLACAAIAAVALPLAAPGSDTTAPRNRRIALASGSIDVQHTAHWAAQRADPRRALIKLPAPPDAATLTALRAQVASIEAYLPFDTFLVTLAPEGDANRLADSLGASWAGSLTPAMKLAPAVQAAQLDDDAPQIVALHLFADGDWGALRGWLAERDIAVVGEARGKRFPRLRLLLSAGRLAALRDQLAERSEIFWVGLEGRRVLLNDTTVWVGQAGLNGGQSTPVHDHGLLGEGQVIAVLDTGVDPDSCFFRDPARGLPPANPCDGGTVVDSLQRKVLAVDFLASEDCSGGIGNNEWDNHGHGTHVAGTAAGDNLATPGLRDSADGMAPAARLVIQDGGFVGEDDCADLPGLGCPVVDLVPLFQQAYDQGARIHSNSWGDRENFLPQNLYSAGSEDVDEMVWTHRDLLLLFAGGNSGPAAETVGSPGTAKNALAVGATQRGTRADSLALFSSCGPTDDGRIKPDLTLPGDRIVSAGSDLSASTNNCGTATISGTSMATPGVAGLAALARQYLIDGWYPSGTAVPADGFAPSAALLRALLINSSRDMAGAPEPIPGGCQGWGRVTLDDALYFAGDSGTLWLRDEGFAFASGAAGQVWRAELQVPADAGPLEVTLTWTDFPSTPAAAIHLVNDLDLELTSSDGLWRGNVFANASSQTGGSADRLNNEEVILLPAPATGRYELTVRAYNVPMGPQPFALVGTGELSVLAVDALFLDGFESGDTSFWAPAP